MGETNSKRKYGIWLIRALGSAAFLNVLSRFLPIEDVAAAVGRIDVQTFVGVVIVFLLIHVAAAFKWRWLMGPALTPAVAVHAHYAGLAANLCLPGAVGGDVVRVGLAQAHIGDIGTDVAASAIDRAIDIVALLTVSVIGLSMFASGDTVSAFTLRTVIVLVLIIGGLVYLPQISQFAWKIIPRLPGRKLVGRLAAAFRQAAADPFKLVGVLVAATSIQAVLVILTWWLAIAAGAEVALDHWMFAWPLAKIIADLPVSLNGLGLREASLAALLVQYGADPAAVVAAGLVWQAVLFLAGGLGGLVFLLTRRSAQS